MNMLKAWNGLIEEAQPRDISEPPRKIFQNRYSVYLAALASNFSRKPAFEREGNLFDIPDNKLESIPAELISEIVDEAEYTKVKVEGPKLVQHELRKLVFKFKDIFKSTVQASPAKLTPFKLEIDKELGCTPHNQTNIRSMDQVRSRALSELTDILKDHDNIIEPCAKGQWQMEVSSRF